ncbi:MAG: hypothetical protein A3F54_02550 [Candidatus Kerfeldbacteria bacterium RIFCSPHIGHO2_12_FULL_48_17]|uniref:Nucleotidyl transferase AbiEii/AbiGii toxin family protein n=1 Tax=Candidatus Kerfeldbacteria bacterium RIFCSPHIGHO2_12_FULL_48_17 TaxID=1798542 RepID=A0A1G2AYA0_9BACT|nr:MAG: hypothetical protein A3F54_02550 [Candidatus Kerfeldbacteria bacterium RIFCSPHIGHO2_12_FULL_48_17]
MATDNSKIVKQLHTEALPQVTRKALKFLSGEVWLKKSDWYLAGGTALALFEGHRKSYDLDFFLPYKDFTIPDLLKYLPDKLWHTDIARDATVYGKLMGAKVSFIAYPFFKRAQKPLLHGSVKILQPKDIAVMKIIAISQRGRKRDFFDLYWYVTHHENMEDIIMRLPKQYPTVAHDYHHILKSLVYFADADQDPDPIIFFSATWKGVKKYFEKEVPKLAKKLLSLI